MRYRTNPWPSFADLFSATLIVTFAGMVLIMAAYRMDVKALKGQAESANKAARDARAEANNAGEAARNANSRADLVAAKVRQARIDANNVIEQVKNELARDPSMKVTTSECGEDTCLNLYIEFERDKALIKKDADRALLAGVAGSLRRAIDKLPAEQRRDIEIVIEGHTDKTVPTSVALDERDRYLYNWDLSARRATSVAYEFKQNGLTPDRYRIVAIGYAASEPICFEDSQACDDRNRRTTLFLRGDARGIEKRARTRAAGAAGR